MMIVQMDKMSAPSSSSSFDRAQLLYDRNIELENKRRKSAQSRIPSDPNLWLQMRENYESIILEDHGFSEQYNIEYALWQLHYRRIEELRSHFNAALASAPSNAAKAPVRPDRITKIRLQFKTFLSEATGFYHDLILKIRSKYGLPLGYFSEGSDNRIVAEKDGKKSSDMKKGLISCHRCLIYLGDLARYKGLYGDGDSKTREYAAASSYYFQAASLWPSSGNPHHQLAILASYSGDELVAVYRYFRSLAVDNPFTTARDNLIVAFEKNRQTYSQLVGGGKVSGLKDDLHMNGRRREKGGAKAVSKELNLENGAVKENVSNVHEMLKLFCTRFVRLNGILFTRTSLETFAEVLTSTSSEFCELLSSGTEEQLNFGAETVENGLFILRLVCILMFTVHNVKREAEGQTYAEIVQRAVLLQNAFTSIFEFMGCILERCVQLLDPSTSYFLPGVMVFVEWLASYPDVASGSDMDEKQAAARLKFWKYYIAVLNKVLSVCSISFDDNDDETCFSNMTRYEEGETENRLALWEDFELRGFVPLLPAQTILDFSRKQPLGNDGIKEKMARIKRILAAGKALASIVKLDQKTISLDSNTKKFVIGAESSYSDDSMLTSKSSVPEAKVMLQELQPIKTSNLGMQPKLQPYVGGDDEDEVIVFKPPVVENRNDLSAASYESVKPIQNTSFGDLKFQGDSVSVPLDIIRQQAAIDPRLQVSTSFGTMVSQHVQQPIPASKWLGEEVTSLANSLKSVKFMENGQLIEHEMQKGLPMMNSSVQQFPVQNSGNLSTESMFYSQINPSKIDAVGITGVATEMVSMMPPSLPSGVRKSPVSRPVRHLGPPPGFSSVPAKQLNESVLGPELNVQNPLMDDYSWLDGYQLSSTKGSGFINSSNVATHPTSQYMLNSNGLTGNTVSFPFPGKQIPPVQSLTDMQNGWQNYQALEHLRVQQEQQLQQQLMNGNQQLMNGNQPLTSIPEQYQGQSIWSSSRYMV